MNEKKIDASIVQDIADYYSSKIIAFGATPQGVDWNGNEGQTQRFNQLTKMLPKELDFSIADLGCGYGALYDYLTEHYRNFNYYGYDISEQMLVHAINRYKNVHNAKFVHSSIISTPVDFSIASGIFNVRQQHNDAEWLSYIIQTLDSMNENSRLGFSFNCLTSYSEPSKMKSNLYYADPLVIFDLCKRKYARNVALLHDYGLYEFTIIVRKDNE